MPKLNHSTEILLLALSVVVGALGLLSAWVLYRHGLAAEKRLQVQLKAFYALLADQLRIDSLYEKIFVQPYYVVADFARNVVGPWIGSGLSQVVTQGLARLSDTTSRLQNGYLPLYLLYIISAGLVLTLWVLLS